MSFKLVLCVHDDVLDIFISNYYLLESPRYAGFCCLQYDKMTTNK